MELSASERQFEMLRIYADLVRECESWAGKLVLAFGSEADLVPVPVSLAGGATLLIDEDAAAMKATMRRGELDFVVRTLDEALRVLKNEIRQGRAVSVGLVAPEADMLTQMAERGVAPHIVLRGGTPPAHGPAERSLRQLSEDRMGWRCLLLTDPDRWQPALATFGETHCHAWHVVPKTLAQLRAADELLLAQLAADDGPRLRWLQRLPRYVRDSVEGGRWLWLSEEEVAALPDWLPITPERQP